MALSHGLHRGMAAESCTEKFSARCRDLWWTVYILDRTFASLMGVPTSIQDEDITALIPSHYKTSPKTAALNIQVSLSRLIAKVLSSEYLGIKPTSWAPF